MCFIGNDGLQIMFDSHPTFSTIQLQKVNYVISWKSKGLYGSTLSPQCTHFLRSIKRF